ncbi:hypothetical protein B0H10DRAFT_1951798 [Mycena sp. CBHHK59/15]|nr:hypothetical protein B0H10DRAFT_1951798 [Mycena sp. CBHHK59/15]
MSAEKAKMGQFTVRGCSDGSNDHTDGFLDPKDSGLLLFRPQLNAFVAPTLSLDLLNCLLFNLSPAANPQTAESRPRTNISCYLSEQNGFNSGYIKSRKLQYERYGATQRYARVDAILAGERVCITSLSRRVYTYLSRIGGRIRSTFLPSQMALGTRAGSRMTSLSSHRGYK